MAMPSARASALLATMQPSLLTAPRRVAQQGRIEALFTGGIEIVGIDQGGDPAMVLRGVNHMDGDTPDLHVAAPLQFQGGVGIGCLQSQSTLMAYQRFRVKPPSRTATTTRPGRGRAAVHHQQIAVMNAGAGHGIAAHSQKERAGGMPDQLVIEIDSHLHVIVRGRGKASGDAFAGQGQVEWMAFETQGLWQRAEGAIECHGDEARTSSS